MTPDTPDVLAALAAWFACPGSTQWPPSVDTLLWATWLGQH
jgi:hypothetical protein